MDRHDSTYHTLVYGVCAVHATVQGVEDAFYRGELIGHVEPILGLVLRTPLFRHQQASIVSKLGDLKMFLANNAHRFPGEQGTSPVDAKLVETVELARKMGLEQLQDQ